MLGLALSGGSAAHAGERTFKLRTGTLVPEPGGSLYCKVVATSATPIGIVATIVDTEGANVTQFGTGFRASPEVAGTFYAEETAGSLAAGARFCRATVTGARRTDIVITLTSFDRDGAVVAVVDRRGPVE